MFWKVHLQEWIDINLCLITHYCDITESPKIKIGDKVSLSRDNFRTFDYTGTVIAVKQVTYFRESTVGSLLGGLSEFIAADYIVRIGE